MRINRFLAACGVSSRRGAEALVEDGRVAVNGAVVTSLATFVEPGRDRVEVDGQRLALPSRLSYLLLNKPVGTVTTADDPEGRPTVVQLVPPQPRVFPVGRLDYDTGGALLLTNDGALAHRLLHPRYKVDKEYAALVTGTLTDETVRSLERGVELDGRRTAPSRVTITDRRPGRTRVRIVLREGRNRQVRRMFEAVGHSVAELTRVRFGPVLLGTLQSGLHRPLTDEEVKTLRTLTHRVVRR
jgi:23S rRNA pseudouridine2605 synthase